MQNLLTIVVFLLIIFLMFFILKGFIKLVPILFGKSLAPLALKLETSETAIEQVFIQYQEQKIPKKTGGSRVLHIPGDKLKKMQKKILKNILYGEQVHPCSYAYRTRKSTVDNAQVHLGNKVLIKLDIRNFFPSIKPAMVQKVFNKIGWHGLAAEKLTELCTWQDGLPQGAPTSPALSNLVLKELDQTLFNLARMNQAKYSRYADDLTFSLMEDDPAKIRAIIKFAQKAIEENGFRLNFKKGKFFVLRPHQSQRICGITINSGKTTLSRRQRRYLRSVQYRMENGKPTNMSRRQLQGHQNFVKMIAKKSV